MKTPQAATLKKISGGPGLTTEFAIARPIDNWFGDFLQIDPAGIVRFLGWSTAPSAALRAPAILANSMPLPPNEVFRYARPDIPNDSPGHTFQTGVGFEYLIPEELIGGLVELSWEMSGSRVALGSHPFLAPHYRLLLRTDEVLHREHIYGVGPPNPAVHPDVVALARTLPGPLLDFGCGRGALMRELAAAGADVWGVEIDSELLRQLIPENLQTRIHLYKGQFPLPFTDGQFRSVVCSEVLEHIPDYRGALREIARVSSETALFTVPNASAIPLGFRHHAVPWHLLEGSHVNFFTQQSLATALAPHFQEIEFGRIGQTRFNDSPYFVSLVALCRKRLP